MTINLFISYRSKDSDKVDMLVARLRSLTLPDGKTPRYQVWQDKTDITPGEDWWQAIVKGIAHAQVFVYMLSRESATSENCRAELAYARKRNHAILPVVLEGEFVFNPATGKNDLHYWPDIPPILQAHELRAQFLFYEGTSFVNLLNAAVAKFAAAGFIDTPAPFPPDPRPDAASARTVLDIYEQACEAALHMDLATAEGLFQRLVDWRDPEFGKAALGWMEIVRAYQKIVEYDAREVSRFMVPSLWEAYGKLFPKPYVRFFDPRRLHVRYSAPPPPQPAPAAPPIVQVTAPAPPPKRTLSLAEASRATESIIGGPFEWCEVPAGPFLFGEDKQTLDLPTFWIAKYPITYSQFQTFIEAKDGIGDERWWQGLAASTNERKPAEQQWKIAKHPRESVNWYQVMAFCRWLSYRLGGEYAIDRVGEWAVRLPIEAEWEKAARGTDGRVYPWGKRFDKRKCNTFESGIGQTTPVDQYPQGASPYGVLDMSGNVWEWCLSAWSEPYRHNLVSDIDITNSEWRTLRGGSFNSARNFAACLARYGYRPYRGWYYVGGRVVCASILNL